MRSRRKLFYIVSCEVDSRCLTWHRQQRDWLAPDDPRPRQGSWSGFRPHRTFRAAMRNARGLLDRFGGRGQKVVVEIIRRERRKGRIREWTFRWTE